MNFLEIWGNFVSSPGSFVSSPGSGVSSPGSFVSSPGSDNVDEFLVRGLLEIFPTQFTRQQGIIFNKSDINIDHHTTINSNEPKTRLDYVHRDRK